MCVVILDGGDFSGMKFEYDEDELPPVFIAFKCEPRCDGHVTKNSYDPDMTRMNQAYVFDRLEDGGFRPFALYVAGSDEPEDPSVFLDRFTNIPTAA
jgi:hypothetical protein